MQNKGIILSTIFLLLLVPALAKEKESDCIIEGIILDKELLLQKNYTEKYHRLKLEVTGKNGFMVYLPNYCTGRFVDGYRFQAILLGKQARKNETIKATLIFKKNSLMPGYYLENPEIITGSFFGVILPTPIGILHIAVKHIAHLITLALLLLLFFHKVSK